MEREFLEERDQRILEMRTQGRSVVEIAKRFGLSPTVIKNALDRQYAKWAKLNQIGIQEAIINELAKLDQQEAAIFPLTQFRNVTLPDGSSMVMEPNEKMVALRLQIIDRRMKLLGLGNVKIDLAVESEPMRVALAGAEKKVEADKVNYEEVGRTMLQLMGDAGIIDSDVVKVALGKSEPPLEVDSVELEVKELESGERAEASIDQGSGD